MSIFGLDLDEVSAKYRLGFKADIMRQKQLTLTDEEIELFFSKEDDSYDFASWKYITDYASFKKLHSEAVEYGIYRTLEAMEDVSKYTWMLSEEGHHIRVITSRFVKGGQHEKVVTDTAYWLNKVDIPYKDIIFTARKTDIFADVYIDDSPSNIISFQKAQRPYIIFDTAYNRDLEGLRVFNWKETYDILTTYPV